MRNSRRSSRRGTNGGVRHVNLGNRIGSRASAAAGFSSDRSANCERRPSRAVLSRRCATRCGCLSEAGRTNQPSPEMQGHDPRQGDGQKDTEKKRSGNQGGQHGERRHHSPSLTHDCVAPRRGQVHDFAQELTAPAPSALRPRASPPGAAGCAYRWDCSYAYPWESKPAYRLRVAQVPPANPSSHC